MADRAHDWKAVRLELLPTREALRIWSERPVAYLPIGCLEKHGDHLPAGLDPLKAHAVCCEVACAVGGLVFPAHHYAGIHLFPEERRRAMAAEHVNLFNDATAESHLVELIEQIALTPVRVLVLYSGHYPLAQTRMLQRIADRFNAGDAIRVIPASERGILGDGDHAGVWETSFMLHLYPELVDMTAIGETNYREHQWNRDTSPERATAERGREGLRKVVETLRREIDLMVPIADRELAPIPTGEHPPGTVHDRVRLSLWTRAWRKLRRELLG